MKRRKRRTGMTVKEFIFQTRPYFEDWITRSVYHSNAIEGNTLSYAETYAILWNDNSFQIKATARELYEATNLKYALNYALEHLDEELSEAFIIEIARRINRNIDEIDGYRTVQVFIQGAEHLPPAPALVKNQMMYFVYNYHHTVYSDIFEKMAVTHLAFERIHPFADGNGRTGRVLLSFELLRNGYLPIVIPQESRTDYFRLLAEQNAGGLAEFFRQCHQTELERAKAFGFEAEA